MYRARLRAAIRQAIDARRRLAAVRPLHGAGAVRARAGLLRARRPPVRRAAGVGQRLRHRAGADAAVRPRAGAARCAQALDASGTRRGRGSSAPARARWPRSCSTRWASACAATASSTCPARCARASSSAWRASARACRWLDALPEARSHGVVVGNEVLDAMPVQLLRVRRRRAGSSAAWRRTPTARSAWRDRPTALRPPLDGPFAARHRDRDPPAGRSLRRHAGRAPAARRGVLHRLRLSGGRVLPPAAPRRHADVPPRPPGRHRPAGRRRRQGHHRARQLHRHRAGRRRTPGSTCWATRRRRAS